MPVISVVNSKGGVGKTSTCINLGHALARAGQKTLIIDMDMQDNVRIWFNATQKKITIFEIITEGKDPQEGIVNVRDNLDIIPSGGDYLGAVSYLLNKYKKGPDVLQKAINNIRASYNYIIIDCSPSRSLLHTIAVIASDMILVPVSMEWLAVVGSGQVNRAVDEVKNKYNLDTEIKFIVPTFLDRRRNRICDEILDQLKAAYKDRLTNPIRVNSKISESPGYSSTVFDMADQKGIEDFTELAERVMQNG